MSDLTGVNDTLPVRIGGVSSTSGLPDNYADVNSAGSLQVAGQGVAGTPAGGVVSVQGVIGGTALPVSQSTSPWITKDQADGPVSPGTAASFSMLMGGQYNSTQPTLTNTQQAALQLDVLGNLRATLPDRQITGTLGSLGATITLSNLNGMSSGALELDGAFSGTVLVEGASGSSQYCTIALYDISIGYTTALNFTGATVQGNYQLLGIGSYTTIKATVSAYTSGSLAATLTTSYGIDLLNVVSPYAPNFNVQAVGNVASGTADSGNGIKVSGIYNSATPTFLNGQRADLQTDSSGNLKITGTVIANNPSVSQVNTVTPSYATYVGGYASTSPPTWGNGDLAPLSIINVGGYLRTSDAANGPVTPGTVAAYSILGGGQYNSTLPTLTNTQQAALQLDSSGRLITVLGTSLPSGSATIGAVTQASGPWTQNLTQVGGSAIALGQTTMSASFPVTIASNQSALPVSQSGTWTTGRTWTLASGTDSVSAVQSGTWTVQQGTAPWSFTGNLTNNNAAPTTTNIGALVGLAEGTLNASRYTTGDQVLLVTDLAGNTNIDLQYYLGAAVSKTNPIATTISDGTNVITSAISAYGTAPTGTEVMGVNAYITNTPTVNQGTSPWLTKDSADGPVVPGTVASFSQLIGGQYNTTFPVLTSTQQSAIQLDASGRIIPAPLSETITSTFTSNGNSLAINGSGSVFINIAGTWSGSIAVLGYIGGTGYNIPYVPLGVGNSSYTVANITGSGAYQILAPAAYTNVELIVQSWSSGTATVTMNAGIAPSNVEVVQLNQANLLATVYQGTSPWVVSSTPANLGYDTNWGTVGATTLRTASQIGNATGAADFGAGATDAQTLRVVANQGNANATPWNMNLADIGGSALALGQTTMSASIPVTIASNQSALPVSQSGTWTVQQGTPPWTFAGNLTNNNAAPAATNLGALVALAEGTLSASRYTTGDQVLLVTDLAGNTNVDLQYYLGAAVSKTNPIATTISDGTNVITAAISAYGTAPTGTEVMGVNAYITNIPTVNQGTSPWIVKDQADGSATGGTAGSFSQLAGGIYNSAAPTLTTGQQASLQLDSSGNLKVSLASEPLSPLLTSDAADGAIANGATGTKAILGGAQYLSAAPTLTTGNMNALLSDVHGNLLVDLQTALPAGANTIGAVTQGTANTLANAWSQKITDGTNGPVAVKPASTAPLATDPALVVTLSPNSSPLSSSTGSGTISALNGTVIATASGAVTFSLSGTWVGTLTTQAQNGDGQWWNVATLSNQTGLITNSTSINGVLEMNAAGWTQARVIATAWTSGTVTVTWAATSAMHDLITYSSNPANMLVTSYLNDGSGNSISSTAGSLLVKDNADGPVTPGAAAANSTLIGGQYNSTLPTLTTGQQSSIQTDSNGRILTSVTGTTPSTDISGSGNITALNQAVTAVLHGCSAIVFDIEGTFSATVTLQATVNGTNWFNIQGIYAPYNALGTNWSAVSQITVGCGGYQQVRLLCTSYTSGTVNISWDASAGENFTWSYVYNETPSNLQTLDFAYSTSSSYPDPYNVTSYTPAGMNQDAFGNLQIRGPAISDEGSFRDDFTGTSLTTTLSGTISFQNGSTSIEGTGGTAFTTQVGVSQYIKINSDSEADYAQVGSVENDSALTLDAAYAGSTNSGATGVVSNWKTTTGSGSLTVATSLLNIGSGTTSGNTTAITRDIDYLPLSMNAYASISQRIANQTAVIGFVDSNLNNAAVVQFTGTTNTQVNFITAFSSQTSDIQTTLVTLPNSATTATINQYVIDLSPSQATLSINGIIVAINTLHLPGPYADLQARASITNSATVTATTLSIDNIYFENIDRLQVTNDYAGEPMPIEGSSNSGQPDNNSAPVKVGAIYNSTAPTYATGQRTDLQTDANGNLLVGIKASLPAGANIIGAVTQNGTWTDIVTQATAANLNAQVVGPVPVGSAVSGNPVQIGGSDGTNVREVAVIPKGTQGAYAVSVQDLKDSGRNLTNYFMATQVVSTATETLQSLTGYTSGAAVVATTTPAVIPAGKTYRIQKVAITYIGVTTAGAIQVNLRANLTGVVAVSSPLVESWLVGSNSVTAGTAETIIIDIPDGMEFAAGTGLGITVLGISATGTATAVGYAKVSITGYQY